MKRRSIEDIYTHYKVPSHLALHMYRVCAFACVAAENLQSKISESDLHFMKSVCLLHDIANILKFDFRPGKLLLEDTQDIQSAKEVYEWMSEKYGKDEHLATVAIAKELGMSEKIIETLSESGISKIQKALQGNDWGLKLARVADEYIAPFGITSIKDRYADILKRYEGRKHKHSDEKRVMERMKVVLSLSEQIDEHSTRSLTSITNEELKTHIETLKSYTL